MEVAVLLLVVVRAVIVYAFLFGVVRVLGKRKLGLHSAFDLIIAVLLADLASQAIFGTVTFIHALLAVGVVAATYFAGDYFGYHSPRVQRLLLAEPRTLVRDGEILLHELAAERVSKMELWSMLRQHGVEELAVVKLAVLEPSGKLTVIRQEWAREALRGDVQSLRERGAA